MIKDYMAWELYEKGKEQVRLTGLFDTTDKCYRFYAGDQWRGIESGGESLPIFNIIRPIVNTKVATVAQNKMSIVLNPLNYGEDFESASAICAKLTDYMALMWEKNRMDYNCYNVIKDACICGEGYIFFYDKNGGAQVIDKSSVFFSDEQNPNINEQKYILITERRFVSDVKEIAKKNKIKKEKIDLIEADTETDFLLGDDVDKEVKGELADKCLSVLMLWLENGVLHMSRAVRNCVYQPDTVIDGMKTYPLCCYRWEAKKGSARGIGEVERLLNNQIEINRSAARMQITSKLHSFPKTVYKAGAITNAADLDKIGAAIEIDDANVQNVANLITYLQPQGMSGDAMNLWQNLLANTKELSGANDALLGNINPEQASGAAIIAVKSQAQIALNEQTSAYRQFVEDIANVWYAMWLAYNPAGMTITVADKEEFIPLETLEVLKVSIRIDVCSDSPFDRFAAEQSVEKALQAGYINFDEYVKTLDNNSTAPKGKFEQILKLREQNKTDSAEMMPVNGMDEHPEIQI